MRKSVENCFILIEFNDNIKVVDQNGNIIYCGEFGEIPFRKYMEIHKKEVIDIESVVNLKGKRLDVTIMV